MIGRTISHYEILEKLGEGGMGIVYKAFDTKLQRHVAIKFLPAGLAADPMAKERFVREALAASALEHTNICNIHEIDETGEGQTFIVMACYEGEMLKEKIDRGPLKLEEVVDIATQVAQGLAKAHEQGIVHRDVKPANIFVTSDGVVKILDFGLAKLGGQTKLTREGTTLGTVAYMSPEQTRGEDVDHRTDIWSLGVLLYEMVSGVLPFKGDYDQAVMYSIVNEKPEPVTGLRTGIPIELEQYIDKALEKNPDDRYQRIDELIVDLRRLQTRSQLKRAASESDEGVRYRRRDIRRYLIPGIIIACLILVVIGYFIFAPYKKEVGYERKMLVVLPFQNIGNSEDEYFAAGMTEEITTRLSMIQGLGVVSRTSALHYAGTEKTIGQIGDELGVDYVLEGTVRWARTPDGLDRVRITPQLIRASDDTHLWAEPFDRVIDDIFKVQSEISQKVAEALGIALGETERKSVEATLTNSLEAYHAYLRGRYFAGRPHFSLENWKRVLQNYQRSVELDPDFALAHAELAKAHARLYYFQHDLSEERLEMAKRAAERAIELAPASPQIHIVLSYYHLWAFRDAERASKELDRAEKGLPDNADVWKARGYVLWLQGRMAEAQTAFEKAFELSPRDADIPTELTFLYWLTRRYPQGMEVADRAIALAPDAAWPYLSKVFVYWSWKGATREARAALEFVPKSHSWAPWVWFWQEVFEGNYQKALESLTFTSGDWIRLKTWVRPKSLLSAFVYELMDEPARAHEAYESAMKLLEREVSVWPQDPRLHSSLGIAYAALGRKEEAIRKGKRAVELLPISKDAFYGIPYIQDLAFIYTLVGEYDEAIDQIENLLLIPSWYSVAWLQTDPRWDPLRDHQRFQKLLKEYAKDAR